MRFDLIIRGGEVVAPDGVLPYSIGIVDGVIVAVEPQLTGSARETIDATDLYVLPAVIDAHVHFNDPGRSEWEGFETGSAALAAGGGSCFIDMPLNASPPTLDAESFDLKLAAAAGHSVTDFAFWGGIVPGNLDRLGELADRGVVGFKAFMSDSGVDDFERVDDDALHAAMVEAARLGLPVAVHAEDEATTATLTAAAIRSGRRSVRDYLETRPPSAEVAAIARAVAMAEEAGCSLHIVHISSAAGIAVVSEARARGVDVTCETCPHYLALTVEDAERLQGTAKCAPPLRERAEVERLWTELAAGRIHLVASDHSPAPEAMKRAADIFAAWGGIAGCQTTLAAMVAEGHLSRGLPLTRVAELLAEAPAERFAITGKGWLEVGFDADLVLMDPLSAVALEADHLAYRHRSSPFLGKLYHGMVKRTLVRGQTVFRDGVVSRERPGRLITPGATRPVS